MKRSADRSTGGSTANVRFSILEKCHKAAQRYRPFAPSDATRSFWAPRDGNGGDRSRSLVLSRDKLRCKPKEKTIPRSGWLIVTGPKARDCARHPADSASRTLRRVTTTFASMLQSRLPTKVIEDDTAICCSIIRFEYDARNEATG